MDTTYFHELEDKLKKHIVRAEFYGGAYAEAKALFESLEDKKRVVLATLTRRFEGAENARQQQALADPEYSTFLEGLAAAAKKYYQAQVDYDMAKLKVEAIRTLISTRREELKYLGQG